VGYSFPPRLLCNPSFLTLSVHLVFSILLQLYTISQEMKLLEFSPWGYCRESLSRLLWHLTIILHFPRNSFHIPFMTPWKQQMLTEPRIECAVHDLTKWWLLSVAKWAARPGQARPDQTMPGQTRPRQTRPDQTRSGQTRPGQTRSDHIQTRIGRARLEQSRPDQTRSGRARLDQTRPDQAGSD
jgi:hypothetical protein